MIDIAVQADTFARAAVALLEFDGLCGYIDLYMMYYRIEYTRLYEVEQSKPKLSSTQTCIYNFDAPLEFCFHESDYDKNCANCIAKG